MGKEQQRWKEGYTGHGRLGWHETRSACWRWWLLTFGCGSIRETSREGDPRCGAESEAGLGAERWRQAKIEDKLVCSIVVWLLRGELPMMICGFRSRWPRWVDTLPVIIPLLPTNNNNTMLGMSRCHQPHGRQLLFSHCYSMKSFACSSSCSTALLISRTTSTPQHNLCVTVRGQ